MPMLTQATIGADLAPLWDVVKNIMLTVTTTGVLWIGSTLFRMRDDVRDLKRDVSGIDGKNGLKSKVTDLDTRVGEIEDRHLAIDAVRAAAAAAYHGEERRHRPRRALDIITDLASERHDSEESER